MKKRRKKSEENSMKSSESSISHQYAMQAIYYNQLKYQCIWLAESGYRRNGWRKLFSHGLCLYSISMANVK